MRHESKKSSENSRRSNAVYNSLTASKKQLYIISMVLDLEDKQLLNMAFGFVNGCFKRQLEKEQEDETNGKM